MEPNHSTLHNKELKVVVGLEIPQQSIQSVSPPTRGPSPQQASDSLEKLERLLTTFVSGEEHEMKSQKTCVQKLLRAPSSRALTGTSIIELGLPLVSDLSDAMNYLVIDADTKANFNTNTDTHVLNLVSLDSKGESGITATESLSRLSPISGLVSPTSSTNIVSSVSSFSILDTAASLSDLCNPVPNLPPSKKETFGVMNVPDEECKPNKLVLHCEKDPDYMFTDENLEDNYDDLTGLFGICENFSFIASYLRQLAIGHERYYW